MSLLLCYRNSLGSVLRNKCTLWNIRSISTTPAFMWLNQRFTRSQSKERRYLEKDRVPQNYQLIYRAPMEPYVAWAMHVSTVTASVISAAAIYQFVSSEPLLEPVGTTLIIDTEDVYYFSAGFIAINAILRFVVSRFTLRIYKDNERYLAVYHAQLPFNVSHNMFLRGEVNPMYYTFSPWNNATFRLGNKSSLLLEDYFKTPSEFHEMCKIKVKE